MGKFWRAYCLGISQRSIGYLLVDGVDSWLIVSPYHLLYLINIH